MMKRSSCLFVLASMMLVACIDPDAGHLIVVEETTSEAALAQGDPTITVLGSGDLGPITQASSSFWATCRPSKSVVFNSATGAIISAHSDSCQMKNGMWAGPTQYVGNCFGDVSNCNGGLQCGGGC
jgi:hypothetical protein